MAEAYLLVPKEEDLEVRVNDNDDDGDDGDNDHVIDNSSKFFFDFNGGNDIGGDSFPWTWRGRIEPTNRRHMLLSELVSTVAFDLLDRRRSMKSATLKIFITPPLFFLALPESAVGSTCGGVGSI